MYSRKNELDKLRKKYPNGLFEIVPSKFKHDETTFLAGTFPTADEAKACADATGGRYSGKSKISHHGYRVDWL